MFPACFDPCESMVNWSTSPIFQCHMQNVTGTLITMYAFSAVLCSCLNTKYAGQCVEVTCVSTRRGGGGFDVYVC